MLLLLIVSITFAKIITEPINVDDNGNPDLFCMYEIGKCYQQFLSSEKVVESSNVCYKVRNYFEKETDYVASTYYAGELCSQKDDDINLVKLYYTYECFITGRVSHKYSVENGKLITNLYTDKDCKNKDGSLTLFDCDTCSNYQYSSCKKSNE
ncbi:hypothetical protein QTN25_005078 [Entamoeba marina]